MINNGAFQSHAPVPPEDGPGHKYTLIYNGRILFLDSSPAKVIHTYYTYVDDEIHVEVQRVRHVHICVQWQSCDCWVNWGYLEEAEEAVAEYWKAPIIALGASFKSWRIINW